MIQDLANKGARTRAPMLRQACRIILRTYSDLYYNVLSAQSPWEDCWHARHGGDILAGSTDSKTATGFMQDRYTWISMRNEIDDQHHDLTQAIEAIQNSDKPARAALLLRDNKTIRKLLTIKTIGVRKYILIEAGVEATPFLMNDNHNLLDLQDYPTMRSPRTPIVLAVVENSGAPPYSTDSLADLLVGFEGIKVLEHRTHTLPSPDTEDWEREDLLKPRHHPLLYQSQMWYKPQCYNAQSKGTTQKKDNRSIKHPHRILMLLGALPPGYGKKLSAYLDYEVDGASAHAIAKIVRDTSLALYMKDEVYRKWRRKGNAWRS